eukprot:COSAG06_NODE_4138_length_4534_cov_1.863811_2_plen_188_part_00
MTDRSLRRSRLKGSRIAPVSHESRASRTEPSPAAANRVRNERTSAASDTSSAARSLDHAGYQRYHQFFSSTGHDHQSRDTVGSGPSSAGQPRLPSRSRAAPLRDSPSADPAGLDILHTIPARRCRSRHRRLDHGARYPSRRPEWVNNPTEICSPEGYRPIRCPGRTLSHMRPATRSSSSGQRTSLGT